MKEQQSLSGVPPWHAELIALCAQMQSCKTGQTKTHGIGKVPDPWHAELTVLYVQYLQSCDTGQTKTHGVRKAHNQCKRHVWLPFLEVASASTTGLPFRSEWAEVAGSWNAALATDML
eukprot:1148716-Pelagomonas_calceolata.AAC.4